MINSQTPYQHLTSAEKVTQGLRTAITSGNLEAGAQVHQGKIADAYNVSRIPVREAFRQLEAEGLLVIYPGRGTFVNWLSADEIHEICDMRILLECDAIRRAVPLLTPYLLQEAEILLAKMAVEEDGPTFGKLDEAFHVLLYGPTQRSHLLQLISLLRNRVTQFLYVSAPIKNYRDNAIVEHRQILDACQAGDVVAAISALKTHLQNTANQCAPKS
ncbi:MAG: GntR family transcriptional regulator, partial [Chloroflexota bacterium]